MILNGFIVASCRCGACWGCHHRQMVYAVGNMVRRFGQSATVGGVATDAMCETMEQARRIYETWDSYGTATLGHFITKTLGPKLHLVLRGASKAGYVGSWSLRRESHAEGEDASDRLSALPVEAADGVATEETATDEHLHRLRQAARLREMAQADRWLEVAMAKADGATMPEIAKTFGVSIKAMAVEVPAAMERARAALEADADLVVAALMAWAQATAAVEVPAVRVFRVPAPSFVWLTFPTGPRPVANTSARPSRGSWATRTKVTTCCRRQGALPVPRVSKPLPSCWPTASVRGGGGDGHFFERWGPARAAPAPS